jgi:hypothetical protein
MANVPLSLFIIGIIAIASFSFYLPHVIEDHNWEEIKTPTPVENFEEESEGNVKIFIESDSDIGDSVES